MRRRFDANHELRVQGLSSRVRNDAELLSTSEQNEVLLDFARDIRLSCVLLRLVACLHFLFALLYICFFMYDARLINLSLPRIATAQMTERNTYVRSRVSATPHSVKGDTNRINLSSRSATNESPDVSVLDENATDSQAYINECDDKSIIFNSNFDIERRISIALCAILFVIGGCATWAAHSRLRVNIDDLVSQPARRGRVHQRSESRNYISEDTSSAHSFTMRESEGQLLPYTCAKNFVRICSLSLFSVRAHLHLAILSGLVFMYWFIVLHVWPAVARLYRVDDSVRESQYSSSSSLTCLSWIHLLAHFLFILWQPFFHLYVWKTIQSLDNIRDKLLALSHMKYVFNKF